MWIFVDLGRDFPCQGPLATFSRTGDHNLPISLGKEEPPGSACLSGVAPLLHIHTLPLSFLLHIRAWADWP